MASLLPEDHFPYSPPGTPNAEVTDSNDNLWVRGSFGTYIMLRPDERQRWAASQPQFPQVWFEGLGDRGLGDRGLGDGGLGDGGLGDGGLGDGGSAPGFFLKCWICYAFAMVVFVCDGLLVLKSLQQISGGVKGGRRRQQQVANFAKVADSATMSTPGKNPLGFASTTVQAFAARRFFLLVTRLPMDLQMVMCHRLFGSPGLFVHSEDSEASFRRLARDYHPMPRLQAKHQDGKLKAKVVEEYCFY